LSLDEPQNLDDLMEIDRISRDKAKALVAHWLS